MKKFTHTEVLVEIKKLLSVSYDQTRCPLCMYVVNVDGNGDMVAHPSVGPLCDGSGCNDEELAEALDETDPRV